MSASNIVAIALLLTALGLVTLGLYLIQEVQTQRSKSARDLIDTGGRERSPAPYRIQRLPSIEVVAKPSAKLPPGRPQSTPPTPRPVPQSAAERKLIGLFHGDRGQVARLIRSAGGADRALHQLLRDRQ